MATYEKVAESTYSSSNRFFLISPLLAAPPEAIQKPVPTLGIGAAIDEEFKKMSDFGITPFVAYYGVFQGNPVGGIEQRTAYSHLILFGTDLNIEKLLGIPGASLTVSVQMR
jgi:porin